MEKWTNWMLNHGLVVLLAWVVVAVVGRVPAPRTVDALNYEFVLPG